jgi:phage-related protein
MPNQVLLTFAGDEKQLTSSFDRVGGSAKKMGDAVGSTSKDLDKHANGLDKVGGSADNAERNIIGVHDVIDGTATIMQGPGKQGIVAYLQGWADLAGGIAPMAEYLAQTKVATLAQAAAQKVAALGAKVWAGTQWLLNAAMTANPIGLVVAAIVALIAVFVIAWKHSETFRNVEPHQGGRARRGPLVPGHAVAVDQGRR